MASRDAYYTGMHYSTSRSNLCALRLFSFLVWSKTSHSHWDFKRFTKRYLSYRDQRQVMMMFRFIVHPYCHWVIPRGVQGLLLSLWDHNSRPLYKKWAQGTYGIRFHKHKWDSLCPPFKKHGHMGPESVFKVKFLNVIFTAIPCETSSKKFTNVSPTVGLKGNRIERESQSSNLIALGIVSIEFRTSLISFKLKISHNLTLMASSVAAKLNLHTHTHTQK